MNKSSLSESGFIFTDRQIIWLAREMIKLNPDFSIKLMKNNGQQLTNSTGGGSYTASHCPFEKSFNLKWSFIQSSN